MLTPPRAKSPVLTWRVALALGSVYVIWGSTYLAIKFAVAPKHGTPLPPMLMPAIRFGVAGVLLLAYAVRRPAADGLPDPLGWRQWRATGIVAIALLVGGNGLVTLAETHQLDSGITAVIVALTPLWVAVIGLARRDKKLPALALVGIVLGLFGVAALVWPTGHTHIKTGAALTVVVASLSWAGGSYYSRSAPLPRRPLVMTGMEMVVASAAFFVVSAVRGELSGFSLADVSAGAWSALAYLTVVGGMVAFTAYVWLLRNAPLSLATTYAYVNPIVAVFLGWLLGDESLSVRDLLATAVVVVSVALILSTHRSAPVESSSSTGALMPGDTRTEVRPPRQ
ncbi:MAG: EamA family transporter [Actinomycetota bacterium]